MTDSKIDAALALAARGFRVFPLVENAKLPAIDNWPAAASSDPAVITHWWRDPVLGWEQDYNVGVATGGGLMVLDVDCKPGQAGEESLAFLGMCHDDLPPTLTVRTASGGRHLYLRSAEAVANSASKVGRHLDVRGHNGYVVGPGSTIDGRVYEITADLTPAPAPAWLVKLAGAPRERSAEPAPLAVETLDAPASIAKATDYLQHAAPLAVQGDGGDTTAYRVAAAVKDCGLSEPMALELMLDHWAERCSPPWAADELAVKVANAYSYGTGAIGKSSPAVFEPYLAGPTAAGPTLAPQFVRRFDPVKLPKRRWLIGSLLLRQKVTEIVAPGGAGKSTFMLAVAVAVAAGRGDIVGMPVHERCPVWYVNNEDDLEEMQRRLAAVMAHHGVGWGELERGGKPMLALNSGVDRAFKLARAGGADGRKVLPIDGAAALAAIEQHQVGLFIGDPFVSMHEVPENDNGMIAQVGELLRQIAVRGNAAVCVVHHTRKLPAGDSSGHAGNADSGRGAGSLATIARVVATLYGMSAQDAKRYRVADSERHLFVRLDDDAKANLSLPSGRPKWFKRVSVLIGGLDGESVGVLAPVDLARDAEARPDPLCDELAAIVAGAPERDGQRRLPLGDAVRQLIERSPMHRDEKSSALTKRAKRLLTEAAPTSSGLLSLEAQGGTAPSLLVLERDD